MTAVAAPATGNVFVLFTVHNEISHKFLYIILQEKI